MFLDGLEDAYDEGRLMGTFAEDTAQHYQFTREQQDDFAIESLNRAKKAVEDGTFKSEIEVRHRLDPQRRCCPSTVTSNRTTPTSIKFPQLKPAFRKGGTVTPANSSSISDGGGGARV